MHVTRPQLSAWSFRYSIIKQPIRASYLLRSDTGRVSNSALYYWFYDYKNWKIAVIRFCRIHSAVSLVVLRCLLHIVFLWYAHIVRGYPCIAILFAFYLQPGNCFKRTTRIHAENLVLYYGAVMVECGGRGEVQLSCVTDIFQDIFH